MFAAKVEKEDPDGHSRLREEFENLVKLAGSKYVPKAHLLEYGGGKGPDDLRVVIMDLVGGSLHYVFKYNHRYFDLRTCCKLAI